MIAQMTEKKLIAELLKNQKLIFTHSPISLTGPNGWQILREVRLPSTKRIDIMVRPSRAKLKRVHWLIEVKRVAGLGAVRQLAEYQVEMILENIQALDGSTMTHGYSSIFAERFTPGALRAAKRFGFQCISVMDGKAIEVIAPDFDIQRADYLEQVLEIVRNKPTIKSTTKKINRKAEKTYERKGKAKVEAWVEESDKELLLLGGLNISILIRNTISREANKIRSLSQRKIQ